MKFLHTVLLFLCFSPIISRAESADIGSSARTYPIVDTAQAECYDNTRTIPAPKSAGNFYGQDAQYADNPPKYQANRDGTVSDLVTGLMWLQSPGNKKTFQEAKADAKTCKVGGYSDWRLPSIKELYSLILFSGLDVGPQESAKARPFIDTRYFHFQYGDAGKGERVIDAQYWSSTEYQGVTMGRAPTVFGVNFADGRIKGYPRDRGRQGTLNQQFTLYVRGNPRYGVNDFVNNGDGTITDRATGLTWQQADSGKGMNWQDALAYAENLTLAGQQDWRLPNAKELQSIIDYNRSPSKTNSAAISPLFKITSIQNEDKQVDYPWFWTSTTHASAAGRNDAAIYFAFGRATGFMHGQWMDVHGAGAQRSDPKAGNPASFPHGRGPQGDAVRILNFVRCMRGGGANLVTK